MDRLTHERKSGIKTGYWSPAKKEELVQHLAAYERTGLTPKQIREMDQLYLDKCQEVAELKKRLEWIPVTERLPIPIETVLTSHEGGGTGYSYYSDDHGWFCAINDEAYSNVIAWMPLPETYWPED